MRKFNPFIFVIMIIAILTTASVIRHIPFAPIILVIVVFSMVRKIKRNRAQNENETHQEEETKYTEEKETRADSTSTIITCDYCGSKVDTSKYSTCNHCGGPYWDDEEWKRIRNSKNMAR